MKKEERGKPGRAAPDRSAHAESAVRRLRSEGMQHRRPTRFFGRSQLEKYFEDLEPDTRGLCDQCQAATSQGGRVLTLYA